MGGQAAEQIIAGVVLSERLAVTMYGAIHRAQWSGQRNLRGLVIDPKLLNEPSFRLALTDSTGIAMALELDHRNIVPTIAVESGGPDVVLVTRGVGRYVTVQDLIAAARANRRDNGKLSQAVAAAIAKSVVEALATAHQAGIVHGAVHPRSVLVDEDGAVRLGDFVVGRALTTAVAQNADSSLWRGLAGYLAPELVVGEDPSPGCDVFAAGALLFTMLSGEVPPGTLHVTPAVERLVQRALDTDLVRRYKNATDLFENLLEAFEDDNWEIADRGEVIKAAGLSRTDTNIDDATEDLLASLGNSAVQVTPMRPSMDIRAEAVHARHNKGPATGANRLDALLADLDEGRDHTNVDQSPFKRDPISELIQMDPRKREAIVQVKPRVPSLDDPDDETPIPPPSREAELDYMPSSSRRMQRSGSRDDALAFDAMATKSSSTDERAAMDALAGLDGPMRLSSAADAAEQAATKLEQAAQRAEAAAARVETNHDAVLATPAKPRPIVAARPIVDPIQEFEVPPPRIKSRIRGVIAVLVVIGLIGGVVYFVLQNQQEAKTEKDKAEAERKRRIDEAEAESRRLTEALGDSGSITVKSTPAQAGVWLKLGRTPVDSLPLSSGQMHELRIDGLPGYQDLDTQVIPSHWSGDKDKRGAKLVVQLRPIAPDPKTKKATLVALPPTPPEPPKPAAPYVPGRGPIHIDTEPKNAEVWLYIGVTDNVRFNDLLAGRAYELRVIKDGYLPGFISVTVDEWRDPKDDPKKPIDVAKKKQVLEKSIELQPDPNAPKKKGP